MYASGTHSPDTKKNKPFYADGIWYYNPNQASIRSVLKGFKLDQHMQITAWHSQCAIANTKAYAMKNSSHNSLNFLIENKVRRWGSDLFRALQLLKMMSRQKSNNLNTRSFLQRNMTPKKKKNLNHIYRILKYAAKQEIGSKVREWKKRQSSITFLSV